MLIAIRVKSIDSWDFFGESADGNAKCCRQKICGFVYLSAMISLPAYSSHEYKSLKPCCDMQESRRHVARRPEQTQGKSSSECLFISACAPWSQEQWAVMEKINEQQQVQRNKA